MEHRSSWILAVGMSVSLALASQPAHAGCSTSGYTMTSALYPPYHYIAAADGSYPSNAALTGRFWLLGSKATHNNGALPTTAWISQGAGGAYLNGDWGQSPLILGCPNPAEGGPASQPTRAVVHVATAREWGLTCMVANASGAYDFEPVLDGGPSGTDFAMRSVCPLVTSSARISPSGVSVFIAPISVASYVDAADGPCSSFNSAVQGSVKLWSQCVPYIPGSPSPPPSATPFPGAWQLRQQPQQPGTPIVFECPVEPLDCYLLSSAGVDGEEVPGCVSVRIECGRIIADRPDRPLKKPMTRREPLR